MLPYRRRRSELTPNSMYSIAFRSGATNLGNIFSPGASQSTVEPGLGAQNIKKNYASYTNILRKLLHLALQLLVFVEELKL